MVDRWHIHVPLSWLDHEPIWPIGEGWYVYYAKLAPTNSIQMWLKRDLIPTLSQSLAGPDVTIPHFGG